MIFDRKTKKDLPPQDRWVSQETVDWSSIEGYEAMRQVNNSLNWPSVWAGRQIKDNQASPVKQPSTHPQVPVPNQPQPDLLKQPEKQPVNELKAAVSVATAKTDKHKPSFWQRWLAKRSAKRLSRASKVRSQQPTEAVPVAKPIAVPIKPPEPEKPVVVKTEQVAVKSAQPDQVSHTPVNNNQPKPNNLKPSFEQKSWDRPTITETNLISNQSTLYFNWNKFFLVLTQWLVVTLFFLSLCAALLYLWQQRQAKQIADVTQRFNKINQLISLTENEVSGVLDFRLRLIVVNKLLSQHVYWNNFFNFLEKNTLPNVFYQDFSGDTKGDYILQVRTDSYDSMAKQIKIFRRSPDVIEVSSEGGERIKNEVVTDASSTEQIEPVVQLKSPIRLKINPDLFFR
jgi:hypothetical protein